VAFAFVDDSGSGGDSRFYVLGGYVASIPEWKSFAVKWQEVLDLQPKLDYFKMSQAESLKGNFLGFTVDQRDERLSRFIDVILTHEVREASVAVPYAAFCEVLEPVLPRTHSSPYYFAFVAMVTALSGFYRHGGAPKEVVDFIFDIQQGKQARMDRLYGSFKGWYPKWQLGRVDYRTDQEYLPLQAADLIAWHNRRFLCSSEGTRVELKRLHADRSRWHRLILKKRDLEEGARAILDNVPNLKKQFGEERVEKHLEALRRKSKKR
jgi:hypothetical protein